MTRADDAPTRVLLADDHAVVRRGLRMVLESAPDLTVVAEVGDGEEAVKRASQDDVDLAVLDISMPRLGGLEAARLLREARPDLKILMLSMHDNEQYFLEALRLGAGGYVLKSQADNDLIRACRSTMRGESFVYPQTEHLLLSHAVRSDDAADVARLTRREAQILRLIAEGHTAREIADQLVISPRTVERHRENLLDKLELRNRVELTRYAIRVGLIEP